MPRGERSFAPEERLSLLQEAERVGYIETCRQYNLSPLLLAKWKQRYQAKGAEGLKPVAPSVRSQRSDHPNDNGSQFLANQVRAFLIQLEAQQEFKHVATPEEKAG